MKLTGSYAGRRNAAVGKAFYVMERRGQMIACKWPVKRGRPLHPTTLEQNEKFKQANKMAQFAPAELQMAHRVMVEGTNLLPRDLMISAMMGRGFAFVVHNQQRRYPMAARQDLSNTLDILGALAGDVLGRGPELWERMRPTAPGQMLTSNLPGELPTWQSVGSQAGMWVQIDDTTLAVALAVGAAHSVVVPVPFKELEVQFQTETGQQNIQPVIRINNNVADTFQTQVNSTVSGGPLLTLSYTANKYFDVFDAGGVPALKNYAFTARIAQFSATPQYSIMGTGYSNLREMSSFAGRWISNTGAPFATVQFLSVAGVGLQIGTRMQVRGIFP